MKKLLFTIALLACIFYTYAQDCASVVSKTGTEKVQISKISSKDVSKPVGVQLWLSRNANDYYLNMQATNTETNKPVNIKGLPDERVQLFFADGVVMETRLIKKTGDAAKITLDEKMIAAMAYMPVVGIFWFENSGMTPSLQVQPDDKAGSALITAMNCMK